MAPMDVLAANNYPQLCFEVGLTCRACTEATARQLAQVCKGLRGKMVGQLFVQIYPNRACSPMHAHFAEAYRVSSSVSGESDTDVAVLKPAALAAIA